MMKVRNQPKLRRVLYKHLIDETTNGETRLCFRTSFQSMLLTYIDSIEPLVASAHAQMQMKQAKFFFIEKICVGPCLFATVVDTPPSRVFIEPTIVPSM